MNDVVFRRSRRARRSTSVALQVGILAALCAGCGTSDSTGSDPSESGTNATAPASVLTTVDQDALITTPAGSDGLVLTDVIECLQPDQSATFTIANPTEQAHGFGPYGLFFDQFPSRETGRILGMMPDTSRLSDFQTPGVVEWPAIGFVFIEPGASFLLTVIAPPEAGTWTLVIATDEVFDANHELVMPVNVKPSC